MSTPLSLDLRVRVLAGVASELSHPQAGERFGVSPASVSRWRALQREQGDARPRPMGGDQRSHAVETHGELILGLYEAERDITLQELRAALTERGIAIGYGDMARTHGRAPRGQRLRAAVPHGHVWTPPRVQAESRDSRGA